MATSPKRLTGRVCLVTGGARGIGRGIALGLGDEGAIVYVTGRSKGDVEATAAEVTARGGRGIPLVVDHSKIEEIQGLFDTIRTQEKCLHVLVNNCYSAAGKLFESADKKFWEKGPEWWDEVNNVGLRAHFVASQLAVPLMLADASISPTQPGLIVHVSSAGGLRYIFDVAYGVGKEALDRMARDMSVELAGRPVAVVSLWPGAVSTELVKSKLLGGADGRAAAATAKVFRDPESPEYQGRAVAALAADRNVLRRAGRTLITADLGREYGFVDVDGRPVAGLFAVARLLGPFLPAAVVRWIPAWIRLPNWLLNAISSKF